MNIVLAISGVTLFALLARWVDRDNLGTLLRFRTAFAQKKCKGGSRQECYEFALEAIADRQPLAGLEHTELQTLAEIFASYESPALPAQILAGALRQHTRLQVTLVSRVIAQPVAAVRHTAVEA